MRCLLCLGLLGLLGLAAPASADVLPATFKPPQESSTGKGPVAVTVTYINDWGPARDVISVNKGNCSRSLLWGNFSGYFWRRQDLPMGADCAPNAIAHVDLDGNGFSDTAVVCDDKLRVFFSFEEPIPPAASTNPLVGETDLHGIATADFENGTQELVTLSSVRKAAILVRYLPDGVIQATLYPFARAPVDVAAAEITRDGHADFVTVEDTGTVTLMAGKGNGAFHARKKFNVPSGASRVALADATGDGKADILVAGRGFVSVLPGNGNGEFGKAITSITNVDATSFAVRDVNMDARVDVVVASNKTPSHGSRLCLSPRATAGAVSPPTDPRGPRASRWAR
ncbi:VCBS repeat-containing protein [Corallococcus sp. bb12-1]|uniref:FG-GAP repeat domain-containing protein n=1 Tax=Corallococcus sp. bb12-1 TaxID=2996784 RepID=UPI00226F12CD|nr:VCBS repeat-containing protein [Corallococcus sp. bb12-1]MCY1046900.1 VCBS repeat-containing protein [Corallococcus sp. bb12-1]